jgi:hypothetical protein
MLEHILNLTSPNVRLNLYIQYTETKEIKYIDLFQNIQHQPKFHEICIIGTSSDYLYHIYLKILIRNVG